MGCIQSRFENMGTSERATMKRVPQIDVNNDGIISRNEFREAFRREHYMGKPPDDVAWLRYNNAVRSTNGKPTIKELRV